MSASPEGFRKDVNGLRAWAVLAVVLYHFGVPGFQGGYVGVDIFFVISGFLMTGIIYRALLADAARQPLTFLWRFYLARGKRIMPALLVLCLALLVAGSFLQSAVEFQALGEQVRSAVLFFSNVKFWRETGYFSPGVFNIWLLHTWSLSVEWQFYMILPIGMLAMWKIRASRGALLAMLIVGGALSLGLCLYTARLKASTAFFLLHCRAWEMIGGGLVALGVQRGLEARTARALELLGLGLIGYSILTFGHQAWPNWHAIIPVAGTMLVLVASRQSSPLTGWAPLQWVGRCSYSMYLWHWPLAAGLHYLELQHDWRAVSLALVLTVVLGQLSYLLVETELRKPLERLSRNAASTVLVGLCVCLAAPALLITQKKGFENRLAPEVNSMFAAANDQLSLNGCDILGKGNDSGCTVGGDKLGVVVLGDSHAGATFKAVAAALPDPSLGALKWSQAGCLSALGVRDTQDYQMKCSRFMDWAINRLKSVPADVPLVIINRSSLYTEGPNEDGQEDAVPVPGIYFDQPYPSRSQAFYQEVSRHMVDTVCALAKDRPVYLVRPVPEMEVNVPLTMARAMITGRQREISISRAEYAQRHAQAVAAQDAAQAQCGVHILDPVPYLCDKDRCEALKDGKAMYYDANHLNSFGDSRLVPLFSQIFSGKAPAPASVSMSAPTGQVK